MRCGDGERDIDLLLVDPASPGMKLEQQFSLASDTQYKVAFHDVRVPDSDRVGAPGSGWDSWEETALDGVTNLLNRARDLAIQAGGPAIGQQGRQALAAEVRQLLSNMVELRYRLPSISSGAA